MSDDAARRTVPGLARARTARDMTQGCLAAAAGVSEKTVRRAEAGQPVSPETRMALKAVLGESLDEAAPQVGAGDGDGETALPRTDAGAAAHGREPTGEVRWPTGIGIRPGALPAMAGFLALACLASVIPWPRHAATTGAYPMAEKVRLSMRLVAFDKGLALPDTLPGDRTIEQVDAARARQVIAASTEAGGLVGPPNDVSVSHHDATLLGVTEERPYLRGIGPGPCSAGSEVPFRDGNCGRLAIIRTGARLSASRVDAGLLLDLDWQDVPAGDTPFDEAHPEPPPLTKSGTEAFVPDGSGKVAVARIGRNLVIVDALPNAR